MAKSDGATCHICGHHAARATPGDRCVRVKPDCDRASIDIVFVVPEAHHTYSDDAVLGRLISCKYAVVDKIGAGGFGAVYRAIQEPVGRAVALKVIRPGGDDDDQLRARFFREAKVVARLRHPATVTLFDYGEEPDGALFMVFELVDGEPLDALIRRRGRIAPEQAVPLVVEALGALSEAHRSGTIHRDLKPANLMVTHGEWGERNLKVLDFGIAKVVDAAAKTEAHTVETGEGLVLGTPRYMAPEQARSGGAEARSDLYALGVVLYEMLTGCVPFDGDTPFDVLYAHVHKPVPALPTELGVPDALESVLRQALAKSADDRFDDASAMARALRSSLGIDSPSAPMPLSAERSVADAETVELARADAPESGRLGPRSEIRSGPESLGTTTQELAGEAHRLVPATPSLRRRLVGFAALGAVALGLGWLGSRLGDGLVDAPPRVSAPPPSSSALIVDAGLPDSDEPDAVSLSDSEVPPPDSATPPSDSATPPFDRTVLAPDAEPRRSRPSGSHGRRLKTEPTAERSVPPISPARKPDASLVLEEF